MFQENLKKKAGYFVIDQSSVAIAQVTRSATWRAVYLAYVSVAHGPNPFVSILAHM